MYFHLGSCHFPPRLVSVNDTKFRPGSMTAQPSSSESKSIVSLTPLNVNVGAVELDISILRMKSRAPSSG